MIVIKRFFFSVLRLSIAFGILYYFLSKIPLSEIMASIISAKVNYVIIALIISILSQFILAYRLKFLTDRQEISLSTFQLLEINLTTVFYGLFLPGGNLTGGAIRVYKLSRPSNKRVEALASIAFDRIAATIALCVIGVLFWLFDLPPDSGYIGLGMIIALGGLLILYILLFYKRIMLSLPRYCELINLSLFSKKLNNLFISLNQYKNLSLSSLFFIFMLSITAQLLGILIYFLLAMSLGIDISLITIGWIRSAVIVMTMLPISLSGLGVREGVLLFLLKPYGILGEETLALSFLVFGATLLLIGAIGGLLEGRKLFLSMDNQ
jgi:hypothetical protein